MVTPTPQLSAIVAVTTDDDSHAAVVQRAGAVARNAGSTVILWDRDAATSPLESPLPTEWSGDGEQEQFGDRLGPNDLIAAGREPLARQVGRLRTEGVDAWAWLPETADAEHLSRYAADHQAGLVLVSADEDDDLLQDLHDLEGRDDSAAPRLRVEAVPR
ncbi:MAG TPA: hypothetical protein VH440_11665 [Candidatus Limnocylindrales bacterium]|jgi:hypothetical protein